MSGKTNASLNNTIALRSLPIKELLKNDVFVQSLFESPLGSLSGVDRDTEKFRRELSPTSGNCNDPWGKTVQWQIEPSTGHFISNLQLQFRANAFVGGATPSYINDISNIIERVTIQQGSLSYELEDGDIGVHHQLISDFDEIDRTAEEWGIADQTTRRYWGTKPHRYLIDIPSPFTSYPFPLCLLGSPVVVRITFKTLTQVLQYNVTPPTSTPTTSDIRLVCHCINTGEDVIATLQDAMAQGRLLYVFEDHQHQVRQKAISDSQINYDASGIVGLVNKFVFIVRDLNDLNKTDGTVTRTKLYQPGYVVENFQLTSNNVPLYNGVDRIDGLESALEILPNAYDSYVNHYADTINYRKATGQNTYQPEVYKYRYEAYNDNQDKDQYFGICGVPFSIAGELANKKQLSYLDWNNSNPRADIKFRNTAGITNAQVDMYATSYNVITLSQGQMSKLLP